MHCLNQRQHSITEAGAVSSGSQMNAGNISSAAQCLHARRRRGADNQLWSAVQAEQAAHTALRRAKMRRPHLRILKSDLHSAATHCLKGVLEGGGQYCPLGLWEACNAEGRTGLASSPKLPHHHKDSWQGRRGTQVGAQPAGEGSAGQTTCQVLQAAFWQQHVASCRRNPAGMGMRQQGHHANMQQTSRESL